jgi:hypothetical protein
MEDFRFEQLDIWKEANQVSDILFDYADKADEKRLYKFAELCALSPEPCALSSAPCATPQNFRHR